MNGGVAERSEAFCILWLAYANSKNAQRSAGKKQGIARNGVLSYFKFMCFLFLWQREMQCKGRRKPQVVVSQSCQPILLAMQSVPVHLYQCSRPQTASMMQALVIWAKHDFSHPLRREKLHETVCVRFFDLSAKGARYVLWEMDEIWDVNVMEMLEGEMMWWALDKTMKKCDVEREWLASWPWEMTHLQVWNTPVYPECVQASFVRIDGAGAAGAGRQHAIPTNAVGNSNHG